MEKIYNAKIERVGSIPEEIDTSKILNVNVGILGHIDSGKTSLAKRLSSVASTAAFDKNPQSKERGITLDLGFSAFYVKTPSYLKEKYKDNTRLVDSEYLQLTLVDCPGHASLIKTVIAGANIIDTVVLVIDVIKGIQTQTTECLILAEILSDKLVVVLNKIDLLPAKTREKDLENKVIKLRNAFGLTKFGKEVFINPVSADPKDVVDPDASTPTDYSSLIDDLILNIIDTIDFNKKDIKTITKKDFLFSIDHCFNIKNKGTIVTGTILRGKVSGGDNIFFPELCETKTVKEMQMFKKPISKAYCGDRVGMLIKNLDHTKIERSIACSEGYVQSLDGGIFILKKINFYKQEIKSNTKFYVIIGNQGVMAKCVFFNKNSTGNKDLINTNTNTNTSDSDNSLSTQTEASSQVNILSTSVNMKQFYQSEFTYEEKLPTSDDFTFAYLKFDQKMLIPPDMIALGSKIDFDVSYKSNRIAFFGKICDNINATHEGKLKIFKMKHKVGSILRLVDDKTAIVKDLFKKDSNADDFIGKSVKVGESENLVEGVILSKFGQTGKLKVEFNHNIRDLKLKNLDGQEIDYNAFSIVLDYKKYIKLN